MRRAKFYGRVAAGNVTEGTPTKEIAQFGKTDLNLKMEGRTCQGVEAWWSRNKQEGECAKKLELKFAKKTCKVAELEG